MKNSKRVLFTAFSLSLVLAFNVNAQNTAVQSKYLQKATTGKKVKASFGKAESGKRVFMIDDQPQPLFWANISTGNNEYRKAGLNTVFGEIVYHTKNKRDLEANLQDFDQFLSEVQDKGFFVIIYIHNSIHEMAGKKPWAFDKQWKEYVQNIIRRYKGVTNLIGWAFSNRPGDNMNFPDTAFQKYLREKYRNIDQLNKAWASNYKGFADISLAYDNKGHGRPKSDILQADVPFGIGAKAFDSANFKLSRVDNGHKVFEETVRQIDADTPLWSGAHNLGWPSTQVPKDWGMFFDLYPGASGHDMETHHVWAMGFGRGANLRPALQMLLPESFKRKNGILMRV